MWSPDQVAALPLRMRADRRATAQPHEVRRYGSARLTREELKADRCNGNTMPLKTAERSEAEYQTNVTSGRS
jgi:hypothetical protein